MGTDIEGKPFSPLDWGRESNRFDNLLHICSLSRQDTIRDDLIEKAKEIMGHESKDSAKSYLSSRVANTWWKTTKSGLFPPREERGEQLTALQKIIDARPAPPLREVLKVFTNIQENITKEWNPFATSELLKIVNAALKDTVTVVPHE